MKNRVKIIGNYSKLEIYNSADGVCQISKKPDSVWQIRTNAFLVALLRIIKARRPSCSVLLRAGSNFIEGIYHLLFGADEVARRICFIK
jgi:hypothetical protein